MASHMFKVRELRGMAEVFSRHGKEVIDILKDQEGQVIDMQNLFRRFTLDSIGGAQLQD